MKFIITGGAGFIGSNMVNKLEQQNHEVVIIDNLSTGKIKNIAGNLSNTKFYLQDIRNPDVDKIFEIEQPDVLIHFAAQASVIASIEDPALDADINIMGLINLLNASVKYKLKKFIFISTGGAIYGDATVIPTSEDYIPDGISPYALTKYTSEGYLKVFYKLYGLKYSVLRLSNVYGPRQVPKGECGVIPIFFEKCFNNEDAVLYAYDDMPTGTFRDYVYVDDVCNAVYLCIDKSDNDIFNIGTGSETSTRKVFEYTKELVGSDNKLILKSARIGDVRRGILDITKAINKLGWKPMIEFDFGINLTYQYIKDNM